MTGIASVTLRLAKLCVSLGVSLADGARKRTLRLLARNPAPGCVVLYYHGVPSDGRSSFARQMDMLSRISVPIPADWHEPLEAGRHYSVVTFDDAFVSVAENALPELRARRIPFTIFVPTGSLGTRPTWLLNSHPDQGETVASAEAIRALAADPLVTIGSHSVTHPDFRQLHERSARAELEGSKASLESILMKNVRLFSFPHGAWNPRSVELALRAGYTRVFTIDPELTSDFRHHCVVGRVRVQPDDWGLEFRLKTQGAYRWLSRASAWKRKILRKERDA